MGKERVAKLTYDDVRYARSRLQGTYVKHKGTLVRVEQVHEDQPGRLQSIVMKPDNVMEEVKLEDLDLTPPQLGYVNLKESAGFFYKMPIRHDWRQGLRSAQLGSVGDKSFPYPNNRDIENLFVITPTVENKFYKFSECLEMLEDGYNVRAFHRDFAIDCKNGIHFRGRKVGTFSDKTFTISLKPEFNWLNETVVELEATLNV